MTAQTFAALLQADIQTKEQGLTVVQVNFAAKSAEDEQQIIYGWASVLKKNGVDYVDSQGDIIKEATMIKAARDFMLNPVALAQHKGDQIGRIVESMVMTEELQKSLGIDLGMVGWLVAMHITDADTWKKAKSGEFTGFSIGYYARREAIAEAA